MKEQESIKLLSKIYAKNISLADDSMYSFNLATPTVATEEPF